MSEVSPESEPGGSESGARVSPEGHSWRHRRNSLAVRNGELVVILVVAVVVAVAVTYLSALAGVR